MKTMIRSAIAAAATLGYSAAAFAQTADPAVAGMTEGFAKVTAVQTAAIPLVMTIVGIGVGVGAGIAWLRKARG